MFLKKYSYTKMGYFPEMCYSRQKGMFLLKVFPQTKFSVPLKPLLQTKWGVALKSVPGDII